MRNYNVLQPDQAVEVEAMLGADYQREMPKATTLHFPDIVAASNAGLGAYAEWTPQDFLQRLPNIVNSTPESVSPVCGIDQWVANNQLLAVAGLGLLAWLLLKGRQQ
jgi:phage tail protein X